MKTADTLFIVLFLLGMPRMSLLTRRQVADPLLLATFLGIAVGIIAMIRLRPWRFLG
jgi:hypothetical protein